MASKPGPVVDGPAPWNRGAAQRPGAWLHRGSAAAPGAQIPAPAGKRPALWNRGAAQRSPAWTVRDLFSVRSGRADKRGRGCDRRAHLLAGARMGTGGDRGVLSRSADGGDAEWPMAAHALFLNGAAEFEVARREDRPAPLAPFRKGSQSQSSSKKHPWIELQAAGAVRAGMQIA